MGQLESLHYPKTVLMIRPDFFDIEYAINDYMKDASGKLQTVSRKTALSQWQNLRDQYLKIGFDVETLPGAPGLPDLVFCANQTFPGLKTKQVLLSKMANPQRAEEVPLLAEAFKQWGFELSWSPVTFEGTGDALWNYWTGDILFGHGFRSSAKAATVLAEWSRHRVISLQLINPDYYHLDTCLTILGPNTAAFVEAAFDDKSKDLLRQVFSDLIVIDPNEAKMNFAGNAHCPDGHHVLLQSGSLKFEEDLRTRGFKPIPVETSEFIKAGGSVFCLKLQFDR